MALWQYEINIIPQGRKYLSASSDEIISWKNINIPKDIDSCISNILPLTSSWSDQIKIYGNHDSTCIEILFENGHMEEILCRLDLRCLSKSMLTDILKFVKSINGEILIEDKIVAPELNYVIPYLKNSNTAKFCSSPFEFFQQITKE